MTTIEEVHSCKKSEGKIVAIEIDLLGQTYCGYCHERVDYSKALVNEEKIKEELSRFRLKFGQIR